MVSSLKYKRSHLNGFFIKASMRCRIVVAFIRETNLSVAIGMRSFLFVRYATYHLRD